jgi:hypothetical protein
MQGIEDSFDALGRQQERQRQEMFTWADALGEGDEQLRTLGLRLRWNTDLTKKQVGEFVQAARMVKIFRGGVSELTLKQIENLLVMGDVNAAMKILNGLLRGNFGALKNLQTPQEAHNEQVADMGQKLQYAASQQRALNRALNGGLGALKNLPSYAEAYAERVADMGQKIAAAAGAQRALNDAIAGAPTGGGNGGGGNGGNGGNSGGTGDGQQRGSQFNVTVNSKKANLDSKELMREVDWSIRSAQWM